MAQGYYYKYTYDGVERVIDFNLDDISGFVGSRTPSIDTPVCELYDSTSYYCIEVPHYKKKINNEDKSCALIDIAKLDMGSAIYFHYPESTANEKCILLIFPIRKNKTDPPKMEGLRSITLEKKRTDGGRK